MKKIIFAFILIFTLLFSLPISAFSLDIHKDKVYLGGQTVGLKLNTGVTISKTFPIVYKDDIYKPWQDAGLKENDVIIEYNNQKINSCDELIKAIKSGGSNTVEIKYLRDKKVRVSKILPVEKEGSLSLGIYIKDNVLGVGTLTYIVPQTKAFGALGHQIEGCNNVKGTMYEATVTGIVKGKVGHAGSKKAKIKFSELGNVEKNTITGVHGYFTAEKIENELISLGKKEDVHVGRAEIVTCINGDKVERFQIQITAVNSQDKKDIKGIKFKVVDDRLITKTGGVVQGMSGSPIIQDGKLIGAVTHVLINNPQEGFGIFIEFMLDDMGIRIN